MASEFRIKDRLVGEEHPVYVIGEIACGHQGDPEQAVKLIDAVADAKADAAQSAGNNSLSSVSRAKSLNDAAADWEATATTKPLLAPVAAVESTFASSDMFGNPTSAMSLAWAKQARRDATAITNAPSGMTLVGNGEKAVIVRHSADDATLRLALPTVKKLQAVSTDFGWIVHRGALYPETIFTPTDEDRLRT